MNALETETKNVTAPLVTPAGQATAQPATEGPVERIRRVLGPGVVMLPIPLGEKSPGRKNWQKTTLQDMLVPEYVADLNRGNIGILLGKPSGNVCAIDIDDDAAVEPFLAANPKLKETLQTRGQRGCQIWVQPTDEESPRSAKLETKTGQAWGEWRATGNQSVIHGRHPKGMDYTWVVDAPAVKIAFDDIVWPADLKLPWGDRVFRELTAEVGEPLAGATINVSFFARVYRQRNIVAVQGGAICLYSPVTGVWRVLDESQLYEKLWPFVRGLLDELDASALKARLKPNTITEIATLLLTEGGALPVPADRQLIHVRNGMLDLATDELELLPVDPSYGSKRRLEIDYLPGAQCPQFKAWIDHAMLADDGRLLQEWVGALLLGSNYSQRILLISGDAGAGKSQLLGLVEKLIGVEYCHQLRINQLGGRFESREYPDKVLISGKDVPPGFMNDKYAPYLKSLSGGDRLTTELKNENKSGSFQSNLHIAVVSNEEQVLRVEGDADAWERRLLSIRMVKPAELVVVAEIATHILAEEAAGVLAWALEGSRRHLRNGYQFELTARQLEVIQKIVAASDGPRLFVEQKLRVDPEGKNSVTMTDLHEAYERFAKEYDFTRLKKEALGRKLVPLIQSRLKLHQRHDIVIGHLKTGQCWPLQNQPLGGWLG